MLSRQGERLAEIQEIQVELLADLSRARSLERSSRPAFPRTLSALRPLRSGTESCQRRTNPTRNMPGPPSERVGQDLHIDHGRRFVSAFLTEVQTLLQDTSDKGVTSISHGMPHT